MLIYLFGANGSTKETFQGRKKANESQKKMNESRKKASKSGQKTNNLKSLPVSGGFDI